MLPSCGRRRFGDSYLRLSLLNVGIRKLKKIRVEKQIGNGIFSLETGVLAKQAAGACLAQYGDTVVLCAAATGPPRPGIDFFPLTCDYRERHAAAGKFPGGFLKREGRPTTKEILTARLTDRPLRPLFPKGYKDEIQIQAKIGKGPAVPALQEEATGIAKNPGFDDQDVGD